jgi:hypothetical protein
MSSLGRPERPPEFLLLTARLCDPLAIVRGYVYYAEFGGSYSIKHVGPVIAPSISYDDIDYVAAGSAAAWAFERIVSGRYKRKKITCGERSKSIAGEIRLRWLRFICALHN